MTVHSYVRTLVSAVLGVIALMLLACGGATETKDPFNPSRLVVFGDALSLRTLGAQFTVNNGTNELTNWTQQIASSYGISTTSSQGTQAGNALLSAVSSQVSTFGSAYGAGDMTLISAGYRDIIDLAEGTASTATASSLGNQYANIVRTMVANGAKHVGVANLHNFSVSYAGNSGKISASAMLALIRAFNDGLKSNLGSTAGGNMGDYVRLLDNEYYFNLVLANPSSYGFTNGSTLACAATGTSIGFTTGTGNAGADNCTTGNVVQASYNSYVYADPVYWTPAMHRSFGGYAYGLLRARW